MSTVVSLVLIAAALVLLAAATPVLGNKTLIVRSGSMSPAIGVGDLVVARPFAGSYERGDVIAFRSVGNSTIMVTHRIVDVVDESGGVAYITKGDANDAPDTGAVTADRVVGRVVVTVPYVGKALAFGKTREGFLAFVVMPAMLIMLMEIVNIVREVRVRRRGSSEVEGAYSVSMSPNNAFQTPGVRNDVRIVRKGFGTADTFPVGTDFGELGRVVGRQARLAAVSARSSYVRAAPVVPTRFFVDGIVAKVLLLAVSVGMTIPSGLASYSDHEVSTGNVFQAAAQFSEIADHVVISEVQIIGDNANQDFIELYNPTGAGIGLSNWRLRKRGSSGTEGSVKVIDVGKTIPAHGFFLWANSQGGYASLIGADVSTTANLSENNSVALLKPSPDPTIVDQVAWGTGSSQFVEGTAIATNANNNQSYERKAKSTSTTGSMGSGGADELKGNGFDSDNNAADFVFRNGDPGLEPEPRNSSSVAETP